MTLNCLKGIVMNRHDTGSFCPECGSIMYNSHYCDRCGWESNLVKFWNCCREIMKQKPKGMMAYAMTYANAGLNMVDVYQIGDQIPYILSNIQYWRGGKSKEIRSELKRIFEEVK